MNKKSTSNPLIENPNAHYQNFKKNFERLAYSQSYHTVFCDFVDFALLMLNINKTPEDFKELESRWSKPEDHRIFFNMLESWSACSEDFTDALGDLFMEYVSGGRNGQYFTPEPICTMMVMFQGDLKDGNSICDPACGSGRMLLAAAKQNRNLKFYGSDNDLLCAKMTALNLIVNTLEGEVAHMDTLSLTHYKSWHISKIRFGDHFLPKYYTTGPGETHFIEKLEKSANQRDASLQNSSFEEKINANKKGQFLLF